MPIYKYVSKERIDILKNAHIRFTQPSATKVAYSYILLHNFNDPFHPLVPMAFKK